MKFEQKRLSILSMALCLVSYACSGCAAHYTATHTEHGSHSPAAGFHYFLPKPYLLVTNMTIASTPASGGTSAGDSDKSSKPKDTTSGGTGKEVTEKATPEKPDASTSPTPGSIVTIQLLWLPDMEEEYVVSVSGNSIGTFKGSLQLQSGWMLTGLNEESDAKVAETLTAASGLLSNIFSAAGLGAAAAPKVKAVETPTKGPIPPFVYLFAIELPGKGGAGGSLRKIETSELNELLKTAICSAGCKKAE